MNEDTWYFAYGSNLSVDQKESRTGTIRRAISCRLSGYRFAFNKRGLDGTMRASIVEDESEEVWGVAFLCDEAAMANLDVFEGVAGGHYGRLAIEVISTPDEARIDAVTYVAGEEFICPEGEPSREYLDRIIEGARKHGLPSDYVEQIELRARRRDYPGSS